MEELADYVDSERGVLGAEEMIVGKKIILVPISMEYLPEYQKWINDPDVSDMLGIVGFPFSLEKERKWVEGNITQTENRVGFTILTKKGEPIGNLAFMDIDYVHRCATLGIMIGEKRYWDRGYGSDAIMTLLGFGFETLGLHRIELRTLEINKRALACYKKCGFKVEGKRRKHWYYEGKYYDDILLGILKDEWDKKRTKGE